MLNYNQKGFSLIGVMVAAFIVVVGLVGILSLATASLKGASESKMRLIASGLAQEGIEVVRGMRRSNEEWSDWYDGVIGTRNYRVQYDSTSLMSFSNAHLRMNASGLYQYSSGPETPFRRRITLEKISDAEVKVVAEVSWQSQDHTRSLIAEERLWNWKDPFLIP